MGCGGWLLSDDMFANEDTAGGIRVVHRFSPRVFCVYKRVYSVSGKASQSRQAAKAPSNPLGGVHGPGRPTGERAAELKALKQEAEKKTELELKKLHSTQNSSHGSKQYLQLLLYRHLYR